MRAFEPIGKRVPRITLETAVVLIRRNWHNADGSELWRLGCRRSSAEGDGRLDTNKSWSMKADLITTGPETTLKALRCRRTDAAVLRSANSVPVPVPHGITRLWPTGVVRSVHYDERVRRDTMVGYTGFCLKPR